jgi:ribosome-binding protein aMBF1 (putative translation factor)
MAAGDVGRIEAGRLLPYESQLKKLARALGWPAAGANQLLDQVAEPTEAGAT